MRRIRRWTSRLAPWAAVIGVLSGGIQLLIWLWSASSYLLTPLMALVLLALGAVCGSLLSFAAAARRTTKRERLAIEEEATGQPALPPAPFGAPRVVVVEGAAGQAAEPIVIRVVREVIGARLGAVLLLLTTATLVVSVLSAVDQPEKVDAAAHRSSVTSAALSTSSTGSTSTSPTTAPAGGSSPVTRQGVPLGQGGAGVVLVDGAPCYSGSDWKESELVMDGQHYDRGGYATGGPCGTGDEAVLSTLTYVLSKRFSRFTAHVGVLDNAPPIPPIRVEVVTDNGDQPLDRRTVRVGEPWAVDIPVAGVVQVTFRVYLPDGLPRSPVLGIAGALGHP